MDRWRTWNAQKLPGRAVNRFVRGWISTRGVGLSAVEVHRTACVVTPQGPATSPRLAPYKSEDTLSR